MAEMLLGSLQSLSTEHQHRYSSLTAPDVLQSRDSGIQMYLEPQEN